MTHGYFTITGEVITRTARDHVVSGEPGMGWRLLADCLIGENVESIARRILDGEIDLTGDSVQGLGIRDSDPNDVHRYIEDVRYIYAGRVRLHGRWYRPSGVVMSLGPDEQASRFESRMKKMLAVRHGTPLWICRLKG